MSKEKTEMNRTGFVNQKGNEYHEISEMVELDFPVLDIDDDEDVLEEKTEMSRTGFVKSSDDKVFVAPNIYEIDFLDEDAFQ